MDGGSFREFKKHESPCQIGGRHYKVFDCKGLILIMTMRKESDDFAPLILWNPAIRMSMTLPRPSCIDVHPTNIILFTGLVLTIQLMITRC
jgi:hypothetical protein